MVTEARNAWQWSQGWCATGFGQQARAVEWRWIHATLRSLSRNRMLELCAASVPPLGLADAVTIHNDGQCWRGPVLARLGAIPVSGGAADVVICRYLNLRWSRCRWLLPELARVLAPGGCLLVTALNPWRPQALRVLGPGAVCAQSLLGLDAAARGSGLALLRRERCGNGPGFHRVLQTRVFCKRVLKGIPGSAAGVPRRAPMPAGALPACRVAPSWIVCGRVGSVG